MNDKEITLPRAWLERLIEYAKSVEDNPRKNSMSQESVMENEAREYRVILLLGYIDSAKTLLNNHE